jgi:hypothetical protein
VTKHFKNLKENHQATLDLLKDLRQMPEFSEYIDPFWTFSPIGIKKM